MPLQSATRAVDPALASVIERLEPGQRIRVIQRVRVGLKTWETAVEGAFRGVNYFATGFSTHPVPEDSIIVSTVHFTQDHAEPSSITLGAHTPICGFPQSAKR